MKIIKTGFFFLLFFTAIVSQTVAQTAVANTLPGAEQARFEAQIRQDTAALRFLLAEDLTYFHSNGLAETKNDFIQSVGNGKIRYLNISRTGETHLRTYGKTGIITGIIAVKGQINEKDFDVSLRYTSVYVKQKKIWKLVAWQSTKG